MKSTPIFANQRKTLDKMKSLFQSSVNDTQSSCERSLNTFCESAQAPSEYGRSDDRQRDRVTRPLGLFVSEGVSRSDRSRLCRGQPQAMREDKRLPFVVKERKRNSSVLSGTADPWLNAVVQYALNTSRLATSIAEITRRGFREDCCNYLGRSTQGCGFLFRLFFLGAFSFLLFLLPLVFRFSPRA